MLLGYWSTVGYYEVLDGTVLKELGETNMSWMSLKWFACSAVVVAHAQHHQGQVLAVCMPRCCTLHVATLWARLQLVEHVEDQLAVHIVL